jgi:protein-tyrosine phosphatase
VTIDYDEIIEDRLWVGSFIRSDEVSKLKSMGITKIISVQSDEDLASHGISLTRILIACRQEGVEYQRIPTPDFDKVALAVNLPLCVAEVEAALSMSESGVYLHCTAGINRAPTIAAAYLIRAHGLSAQAACKYVVERRDCDPYLELLEGYEQNLRPAG